MSGGTLPIKRMRRVSPEDTENGQDIDIQLDYQLDKLKAIQKKLYKTTEENQTKIIGLKENRQVIISCNTATYELIKSKFIQSMKDIGLITTTKSNKDTDKLVVAMIVTVKKTKKGKPLYTANFYNTTSKLLVNGLGYNTDIFLEHYNHLIENIPISTVRELNLQIQQSCKDAITAFNTTPNQTKTNSNTNALLLSDTSIYSTSNDMESGSLHRPMTHHTATATTSTATTTTELMTSDAETDHDHHSSQPIPPNTTTELNQTKPATTQERDDQIAGCTKCLQMEALLKVVMGRMNNMEKMLLEIKTTSITREYMREEFIQFSKCVDETSNSKLECFNNAISERMRTPTMPDNQSMNETSYSKVAHNNKNMVMATHQHQSNITPAVKKQSSRMQKINHNPFTPKKNIVISIIKDSELHKEFNQDTIRRTINSKYGPTIIERVSKYSYASDLPKIMIQLHTPDIAENICRSWYDDLFGGSSARMTISPEENVRNTAMLKGVPLDANDSDILEDIRKVDSQATVERLQKNGKPLRVFKVKFSDEDKFKNTISDTIILKSINMKCIIEPMKQ